MVVTFVQNATLLITLSVLYGLIKWHKPSKEFQFQLISGLWFGFVAVAAMMMPFRYDSGTIYDGRSVVITLAGLWGGGYTTLISAIIAVTYRIYLGGAGVYAGIATLVFCGLTGLFFRKILKNRLLKTRFPVFWGIGIVAHLVMLASQLLIPRLSAQIITQIWMPVLLIFPLAFALIAMLFRFIDEYIRSSQKIREAEQWYRTTLLSIGDAVICTDKNGYINQMNTIAEDLTGWKLQDALGRKLEEVFKIINEDTRTTEDNPFTKIIKNGKIVDLANHTLLISKDNREIPIADSGAPIKNNNEIIGVVLVFRDQTFERLQQKKLLESEEIFRKAVLFSPIPLMVHDEDGNVIYLSGAWTQISGYSRDEIPTLKIWTEKVYGERAKEVESYVDGIFKQTEAIYSGEYEIKTKNGEKRIWNFYTTPLGFSGGKKLMLSMAPDVTHRIRIRKELEESELAYRNLFENHTAIKMLVDPDTGKIVKANQAASEFYGWSIEKLETMNVREINIISEEQIREAMEDVRLRKRVFFEFKHILANGQVKDVEVFSSQTEYKGKVLLHSVIHDVTEKKRLFNELIAAKEKAEESEKLKSAFLANMSHEIRTPLNGILGFTNLLAEDENLSKETKHEFAHIIKKSAQGLLKIINDILDISRLETGKTIFEPKIFEAGKMLSTVHAIFKTKLKELEKTNVELQVVQAQQNIFLNTDENRLVQIFSNLLDNAVRFTSAGSISFGISGVNENEAEFFVSDTGIGIPEGKHQLVFERFIQAESGVTRSYGGTGLGLAIVKKLVELMGSQIYLSSEPGKGTRFWFRLPYSTENQSKIIDNKNGTEGVHLQHPVDSDTRILVVEDDTNSRIILQKILEKHYKNLVFADTGEKALTFFETELPDIILMDLQLPDMDGLNVIKQIREKNNKVWIIAQTAYALAEDERKAMEAGCSDYISKPIKSEVLLKKMMRN